MNATQPGTRTRRKKEPTDRELVVAIRGYLAGLPLAARSAANRRGLRGLPPRPLALPRTRSRGAFPTQRRPDRTALTVSRATAIKELLALCHTTVRTTLAILRVTVAGDCWPPVRNSSSPICAAHQLSERPRRLSQPLSLRRPTTGILHPLGSSQTTPTPPQASVQM